MRDKHTPGPWVWSNAYETLDGRPTYSLLGRDGYGILSCDGIPNSPHDQPGVGYANAHVIAAAPELLEALIDFPGWAADGTQRMVDWNTQVRAAIAKARGE